MSICQAFGSNTFNICICLGLVWLIQAAAGPCNYGSLNADDTFWMWCAGCYMPTGIVRSCPYLVGGAPEKVAGSLAGTIIVTFFCILVFVVTLLACRLRIPKRPAAAFFAIYVVYVGYEVVATKSFGIIDSPICPGGICL